MTTLWTPIKVGDFELPHRLAMAPMTRSRAHPANTPHHRQPVTPSAIAPGEDMFTSAGMQPVPTPRALGTEEVGQTVAGFAHAETRAIEAGASGVEIHGANG